MISIEQTNFIQNTDIRVIDRDTLVNAQGFPFDNNPPKWGRIELAIEHTKNPYCFRYGELGVQVGLTDNGPTLCELLASFLLRKKSSL